ncbi:MAG: CoA transferase subunit A [Candidatus Accumulibacter sp.]|jgi:glutaconate CoA-transferase subunit A|nr:CoA transferase subunit A [Accumulibacter sp.]
MSSNKLISLKEAVSRFTADGIQYASGAALPVGSDAIAFGRELLRQNRRRLHALFHCNSQQLNLLAAAGAVDRAECGFSGLEVFGFANGLRRAVESGRLVLEDYSNLSMALRYLGGALNWPFVPTTVNVGSDIAWRSAFAPDSHPADGKIPAIADPFTGRQLGALSPLKPDLAAIHVTLSDPEGNAIMIGTEWSRFELSRAAKEVVLLADHIVDSDCVRQFPNLVRIPGVIVGAVVWQPFAAWPQGSPGAYDIDEKHMRLMNEWLASEEGTARYIDEFVNGVDSLDDYLDRIGGEVVDQLQKSSSSFLLDPYRKWIKPREEIESLLAQNVSQGEAR